MKRSGKIYQIISVLIYIFIAAAIWLPWIAYAGQTYHLPGYISEAGKNGGIVAMTGGDPELVASYYMFFLSILSAVLALIYVIGTLAGKKVRLVYRMVQWCEFLYTAAAVIFFPLVPMGWTYLLPIMCLAEFVLKQYVEQRDEIRKDARVREERDRLEREERKRRLYFPGRYSSSYYRMIWKNVRYHIRNYVMLIASSVFLMLFLFLVFALRSAFLGIHSAEAVTGGGTQKVLLNAVWMGLLLNAVLMGLSFSYYIRNKMREENILAVLGIRSRSLRSMMLMEYAGCLVCSGIIGIILGNLVFGIIMRVIARELPVSVQGMPAGTYLMVCGIFTAAALIAAMVNSHVYDHMRWSASGLIAPKKNRIPGVSGWICGVLGVVCMAWSLAQMTGRSGGESEDAQAVYLLGLILVLLCVRSAQIRRIKGEDGRYYQNIFDKFPFLTGFGQNMKKVYLLTVTVFLVMYTLSSAYGGNVLAQALEGQFPYDFVCTAGKTADEKLQELSGQPGLKAEWYPMTTVYSLMPENISLVNSVKDIFALDYKSVAGGRQVMAEPPVQIGIPESAYLELKRARSGDEGEAIGLSGEEIAVIYQEDVSARAHLLDWSGAADTLNLQTAGPGAELWSYRAYTPRKVVREERAVLTGIYKGGKEQNLVVFSDEYFEEIYQGEQLYLFCAAGGDYEYVEDSLFALSKQDGGIRYYSSKVMMQDTATERYLKQVVWLFMMIMAGVCGIYLILIKFCFEMDEIVARYRFLDCMGMHEKTIMKALRQEMLPFFLIPLTVGGLSAVVFTLLMFRVRMYNGAEILGYIRYVFPVWGIYWLAQGAVYQALKKVLTGKIFDTME